MNPNQLYDQWVNGNRKHVVDELVKLDPADVRHFLQFFSYDERSKLIIQCLDRIPRSEPRQWYDQNWQPVTEQQVIEAEFPLECPSEAQAMAERTHAEILLKEGTAPGMFQVWIRKVIRAYLYAEKVANPTKPPTEGGA